jgi:hypothetical protein
MPLPPPVERVPVHVRRVTCEGFRRADGLWDIEGHITDVKTYDVPNEDRGLIVAGQPIHEMRIRVTIDESMTVQAVEAVTDHGPYHLCPAIAPNFQRLKGLTIGPGWRRKVQERVGGTHGCTHLVELLGPLATTAFQTMGGERSRIRREAKARGETVVEREIGARPRLLNTCHAFAETSPVVKRNWPEFYRDPSQAEAADPA